jgi:TolA-binding protein
MTERLRWRSRGFLARRWTSGLTLGVVVSATGLWAASPDLASNATSQLQQTAQQAIERQQFADAVPALAELDRRYRESTDAAIVQAREGVLYFLGLGRLQAGSFPEAALALREFVDRYPASRSTPFARLYLGDAWFFQSKFVEAREAYEALRSAPEALASLDLTQQLALWDRLSDCCFAAQDWARGPEVFRALQAVARRQLDPTQVREKTAKAGAYLLQAAIARGELDDALSALPALTGQAGAARYDLSLNLALVRGGDALYERGRQGDALFLYEQVLSPSQLQHYWQTQVQRSEVELTRLHAGWATAARRHEVENAGALARQRLEQIRHAFVGDAGDYTPALQFRIARCYLARGRVFEAYWAFHRLETTARQFGGEAYVEDALYGQVATAAATGNAERVRRAARAYLERQAYGRFLGDVAHELVQSELRSGRAADVPTLLRELIARVRNSPDLLAAPRLVYLTGSTLLGLEQFDALDELLEPLARDFPRHGFADGVQYWLGLGQVFRGKFRGALTHFERVRAEYPNGPYAEDAQFRIGVCRFGLFEYEEAERVFVRFLADHPRSRLVSEAQALLGDLAAAEGRIDDALTAYRAAEEAGAELDPLHFGYINHAIFQAGKLLAANQRWEEMLAWFERYIERWGPQGRLSDALYELGRAQDALGRREDMLESWFGAIVRFGNDPEDHGPDLMLAEYPEKHHNVLGEWPVRRLRAALERARAEGAETLALRLAYALREFDDDAAAPLRAASDQLPGASAAVLVRIARAELETHPELALEAAELAVSRFPGAPFVEDALHLVGELKGRAGDASGALAAFRRAAEQFPASRRTVVARLREGDLLRASQRFDEAIAVYRTILQTRQWRGAPWAEANYKIGLTHFEAGELKEAFGFCQRVYVLYGTFAEWAAPAYLQSGLALEGLGRRDDAVATYRELLGRDDWKHLPASREAARRLEALR